MFGTALYLGFSLIAANIGLFLWHGLSPYYRIKRRQSNLSKELPLIVAGVVRALFLYGLIILGVAVAGVYNKTYLIVAGMMLGAVAVIGVSVYMILRTFFNVMKKGFSAL